MNPARLMTVIALLAVLGLSACTRIQVHDTPAAGLPNGSLTAVNDDNRWWSIAFDMGWDRESPPDWYLDTLLADQVCAPALAAHRDAIGLWRFHRRAAHDAAGHRFSLLVYTDAGTAAALFSRLRGDPVLRWLESDEHVAGVSLEALPPATPPPIAHGSDTNWPSEIQASWPWYIMGVSRTWLGLVDEVRAQTPLTDTSTGGMLDYYRDVNDRVTVLWRDFGQHVYLHHLNAVFGYEPLVIRETNLKRF